MFVFSVQFDSMLAKFSILSSAPSWTFVFCSLPALSMVECASVAVSRGYKVEIYVWNKPDLLGKSHQGGARQATSSEYIVVVYKHSGGDLALGKHFSLLHQKDILTEKSTSATVRLKRTTQASCLFLLIDPYENSNVIIFLVCIN